MYMSNASTFVVETVTLESAVEGEKSGEEITLEVDEPKHVVLDKMNGMNHTQMRNYIPGKLPTYQGLAFILEEMYRFVMFIWLRRPVKIIFLYFQFVTMDMKGSRSQITYHSRKRPWIKKEMVCFKITAQICYEFALE